MLNLWLLIGRVPNQLRENRSVLIPKTKTELNKIGNWRPLTISSVFLRLYSKILAGRFQKSLKLNHRQRGFMARSGCSENVLTLKTMLRNANKRTTCIVLLDLAKAFDTVSHSSINRSLSRHGVDPHIVELVGDLYQNIGTVISVGGKETERIPIRRGVKQGDPLSPMLFNCVVDELMDQLGSDYGLQVSENTTVNCLGYADDLILSSGSKLGMSMLLKKAMAFFNERGLKLNVKKCQGMYSEYIGKKKITRVISSPTWVVDADFIPMTDMDQTIKYLGLDITTRGKSHVNMQKVRELLSRVEASKLRRTQKLFAIKHHVIPRFLYGLGLSVTTAQSLDCLDGVIRACAKRILLLPKNFANELLYLRCKNGGLGLFRFSTQLPLLKLRLYQKLEKSDDPITVAIISDPVWKKDYERQRSVVERWTQRSFVNVTRSKLDLEKTDLSNLSKKVQGFGALAFVNNPGNHWLNGMTPYWQGRQFITALRLRSNLIVTKEMVNRGRGLRGSPVLLCRHGCGLVESQAHILQKCYKVKHARIRRHHDVVDLVAGVARSKGIEVEREVTIDVANEQQVRPDLILRLDNALVVVDVTIVYEFSENSLEDAARTKREKYDCLKDILLRKNPTATNVEIEGFVVGARGAWHKGNDMLWLRIGGKRTGIRRVVESVMRNSCSMIQKFMNVSA